MVGVWVIVGVLVIVGVGVGVSEAPGVFVAIISYHIGGAFPTAVLVGVAVGVGVIDAAGTVAVSMGARWNDRCTESVSVSPIAVAWYVQ